MVRKANDGSMCNWIMNLHDQLCTLKDVIGNVPLHVGFNIELKLDDEIEIFGVDL